MGSPFESDPVLIEVVVTASSKAFIADRWPSPIQMAVWPPPSAPITPDVSPERQQAASGGRHVAPVLILMVSCWRWSVHLTQVSPSTSTASDASCFIGTRRVGFADAGGMATGPARQRGRYSQRRAQVFTCDELLRKARRNDQDNCLERPGRRRYRDPDHPIQLAIVQAIDDLAHEQATNLAIDGCGAPLYAISLYGLARAFGRIASASRVPSIASDGNTEPSRVCVRYQT